ncbi:CBS domain-containing protein [Desulfotomaculum copahuensis]|nr:CBS domain-containing protein [Desulfotomaculum copahuensis]
MMTVGEMMEPYDGNASDFVHQQDVHHALITERVFYPGMYACTREVTRYVMLGVNAGDTVDKALQIMLQERVDSLPVLDEGKIVGIVRAGDLFVSCFQNTEGNQAIKCFA